MANGESFIYELKKSFKYGGSDGKQNEALTISVECPSNKVLRQFTTIEDSVLRCFREAAENAKKTATKEEVKAAEERQKENAGAVSEEEKTEELKQQALLGLSMFGNTYLVLGELKQILSKTAFVNGGSQKVNDVIWNDMSPLDTKEILGEYVANFIAGSLIQ